MILKDSENFIQNKYGYCFYDLDSRLIYNLYVFKKYRKNGHSKTLLKYIIDQMKAIDDSEIFIQIAVRENSIPVKLLISYYEKLGLTILK